MEKAGQEVFSNLSDEDYNIINGINDNDNDIKYQPFSKLLRSVSVDFAGEIAVIAGGKKYSYAEFFSFVRAVAKAISNDGRATGRVGVLLKKSMGQVATVAGAVYSGVPFVPIEYDAPAQRINYCLKEAEITIVITDEESKLKLEAQNINVITLEDIQCIGSTSEICPVDTSGGDLFSIIFTSGSTGRPKGVLLECEGIYNTLFYFKDRLGLGSADRILSVTNVCHDMCTFDYFALLLSGGTIVLPDADKERDPVHWLELVDKYKVNIWVTVPTIMRLLVCAAENEGRFDVFKLFRVIMLGGEFVAPELCRTLIQNAENSEVFSIGGPTETSIINILHAVTASDIQEGRIPYGKPIWNTKYYILDDNLRLVGPGREGEIYNGGLCVSRGYLDQSMTHDSYIEHGGLGCRLYRTGDMGRYNADGYIEILGRADNQVKINGKRIELEEIENVIDLHKNVEKSIAFTAGGKESGIVISVYIQTNLGKNPDIFELIESVREFMKKRLPEYMIPVRWKLIKEFPVLPNGKVDRKELIKAYAFDGEWIQTSLKEKDKNINEIELSDYAQKLIEIEKNLLNIQSVDIHDRFFEIGGHSVLLMKLKMFIKRDMGFDFSIVQLMELPTIYDLAKFMADSKMQSGNICEEVLEDSSSKNRRMMKEVIYARRNPNITENNRFEEK